MIRVDLLGTWLLVDWRIAYPDGRITQPFGERPRGCIIFTDDGWMSASLMRAERSRFDSVDMRQISSSARACAFDEYLSYAGRWRAEGQRLFIEVVVALNPLLLGTTQERTAAVRGAELVLDAMERIQPSGSLRQLTIRWRRPD
jgi:Lipocalin-like domain